MIFQMDYQENFFKEQMDKIHRATEEKEQLFEKLQQEEHGKAKLSDLNSGTPEEKRLRYYFFWKISASVNDFVIKHIMLSDENRLLRQSQNFLIKLRNL